MLALSLQALALLILSALVSDAAHLPRHKRNVSQHRRFASAAVERDEVSSDHALVERDSYSGRGTYFAVGLGACGIYNQPSDYIVALNSAQYGGGYPGPNCFKDICIQANGVTVCGVQITDECPTCDWGGLDLSQGLFERFADTSVGVLSITWWFSDGSGSSGGGASPSPSPSPTPSPTPAYTPPASPSTTPTSTWVAPSSSTTPTSTWTPPPLTTETPSSIPSSTNTPSTTPSSSPASASLSPSASLNSTTTQNPFVAVHNTTSSATSLDPSASNAPSSGVSDGTNQVVLASNIDMVNGLVTNYGLIIVAGAQVK